MFTRIIFLHKFQETGVSMTGNPFPKIDQAVAKVELIDGYANFSVKGVTSAANVAKEKFCSDDLAMALHSCME